MNPRHHLLRPLAVLLATLLGGAILAAPASANQIFRYWAYFTVQDGEYVAAETGPSGATPEDGSVEAYRFAAPADFTNPNLPRADTSELTFDEICGAETAEAGQKRVAVLIDYGVEADADGAEVPEPEAGCAVVPEDANGLQVLEDVAEQVRTESGSFGPMLCAINGYPETGCADEQVQQGTPADEGTVDFTVAGSEDDQTAASGDGADDDDGNLALLVAAAVVVALLVAGGLFLRRRNA